uniref:Uncharacterized protein n=1 Tax=Tanacetum cinerariifolium TaxID=118510 RepID=A0A6L2LEY9_TANCI|nr:hypothetical protein [Tanacetum cinerariifolium]
MLIFLSELVFTFLGRKNNHRKKKNANVGIGSFTKSDGTLNGTNPLKDVVSPSVIDEPVAMEVQSPLVDNTNVVKLGVGSYPSLPTQGTTPIGNTSSKSSYANVIGEPSRKALNFRTLVTPRGTRLMSSYARAMIDFEMSGNKKKVMDPTNEVSIANPFEVFNSVDNDVEFEYPGDHDSDDEVASVDNDMARSMALERVGFGTQSLLEQ